LIFERVVTPDYLETRCSVEDVLDLNDALDIWQEARAAAEKAEAEKARGRRGG
jgi:hypothetical protein